MSDGDADLREIILIAYPWKNAWTGRILPIGTTMRRARVTGNISQSVRISRFRFYVPVIVII
jgi:hypothetical protein